MISNEKINSTASYFQKMLKLNGELLDKMQHNHIMVVYFLTYGLSLTNSLSEQHRVKLRNYVLSLQIPQGGWAGSSFYTKYQSKENKYDIPHMVFTYSAINILNMVGGLDKINRQYCLASVKACEKQNGSFSNFKNSEEADLRFVYSALSICKTLQGFSLLNVDQIVKYIQSCRNFDGGYGLRPHCESHSGATFCALASLSLLGRQIRNHHRTLHFLASRQSVNLANKQYVGLQGRVGKYPDSCYSFWVGASLKILTGQSLLNPNAQNFIDLCYKDNESSFAKYPTNERGDPLHTLHSLIGIRIIRDDSEKIDLERGFVMNDHSV